MFILKEALKDFPEIEDYSEEKLLELQKVISSIIEKVLDLYFSDCARMEA